MVVMLYELMIELKSAGQGAHWRLCACAAVIVRSGMLSSVRRWQSMIDGASRSRQVMDLQIARLTHCLTDLILFGTQQ